MEKGDYIYDPNTGVSFILKDFEYTCSGKILVSIFCTLKDGVLLIKKSTDVFQYISCVNNPNIINEMDKALFKEGYYFDTDNLELVGPRWMPKDEHYCVPYLSQVDYPVIMDYENGVCCKTEAEAAKLEEVALDAIRKYLTNKK